MADRIFLLSKNHVRIMNVLCYKYIVIVIFVPASFKLSSLSFFSVSSPRLHRLKNSRILRIFLNRWANAIYQFSLLFYVYQLFMDVKHIIDKIVAKNKWTETRKILIKIQKLTRYSYNTVIKIVLKIIFRIILNSISICIGNFQRLFLLYSID